MNASRSELDVAQRASVREKVVLMNPSSGGCDNEAVLNRSGNCGIGINGNPTA